MGYSYAINHKTGRQCLACDVCGRAEGTTKKRRCPHNYCQATALCDSETCKQKWKQHDHATCKKAMEQIEAEKKNIKENHAEDYITLAAWGDWHEQVPKGYVGVFAGKGGRLPNGNYPPDTKYFLVPKEEYANPPQPPFIIDTNRHAQCEPIK